jgi:hypothetical protein
MGDIIEMDLKNEPLESGLDSCELGQDVVQICCERSNAMVTILLALHSRGDLGSLLKCCWNSHKLSANFNSSYDPLFSV